MDDDTLSATRMMRLCALIAEDYEMLHEQVRALHKELRLLRERVERLEARE